MKHYLRKPSLFPAELRDRRPAGRRGCLKAPYQSAVVIAASAPSQYVRMGIESRLVATGRRCVALVTGRKQLAVRAVQKPGSRVTSRRIMATGVETPSRHPVALTKRCRRRKGHDSDTAHAPENLSRQRLRLSISACETFWHAEFKAKLPGAQQAR